MSIIVLEGSNGAGKSTIAKLLSEKYDLISLKSVPDWFREYLTFARKCPLKIQKEIYKIGHDAIYFNCLNSNNYILDRFIYTTIIRINFELGVSIKDTIDEILNYKNIPDYIFVLRANTKNIKERLSERVNISFDLDFYKYENKVFEQLSKKTDIIYLIDNNDDINNAINSISNILESKIKIRKR